MNKIKIGLIGLGTVGGGVIKTLKNFRDNVEVVQIAVRNLNKKRVKEIKVLEKNVKNPIMIILHILCISNCQFVFL